MGAAGAMLGGSALEGIFGYMGAKKQAQAMQQAAQPLPTYYQHMQSPWQQQMWGAVSPYMQRLYGGMGTGGTGGGMGAGAPYNIPDVSSMMPGAGWYEGLDPNIRAGIEEPYMRGMGMMRNQLAGGGTLGAPGAGMSGAAADVFGQYMQQAAPSMAQTGWGMMAPGLQAGWGAQLQRAMMPYQMLPQFAQMGMGDTLVGHHPTMQEIQPGAAMPPEYQTQLAALQQQQQQQMWGPAPYDPFAQGTR